MTTNVYGLTSDLYESAPINQDSDLEYHSVNNSLTWIKGGYQSLVIASRLPLLFVPKDGITYPAGVLSKYSEILYRGIKNEFFLAEDFDLTVDWYFYIFAFNGVQSTEKYNRLISSIFVPGDTETVRYFDGSFGIEFG